LKLWDHVARPDPEILLQELGDTWLGPAQANHPDKKDFSSIGLKLSLSLPILSHSSQILFGSSMFAKKLEKKYRCEEICGIHFIIWSYGHTIMGIQSGDYPPILHDSTVMSPNVTSHFMTVSRLSAVADTSPSAFKCLSLIGEV
jgi:hypothetical protein